MVIKTTTLHCTVGRSYKAYQVKVWLDENGTANVRASYGRIGNLFNGTDKLTGASIQTAHRIADKLVQAKLKKGYTIHTTVEHEPPSASAAQSQPPLPAQPPKQRSSKRAKVSQTNIALPSLAETRRRTFNIAL